MSTAATQNATTGEGLVRALGPLGLAAAVANTTIGGGIFSLPAKMAGAVGPAAPLYYLLCAGGVGAVALCFAEAGSRIAVSGGIVGGVERAFGRYVGFLTSAMLWLGCVLAAAGIAAAVADALGHFVPTFANPVWRTGFILLMFATLATINVRGVRAGGGLVLATMGLKLIPLFVLVIVGGLHVAAHPGAAIAATKADAGRAMLLGVFAFMGMETALGVSGEVKNPARAIPFGLLGALAACTVLYMAIQLVCQGLLGPALAGSAEPLADAMATVSPGLGVLLAVGAAVSRFGYLTSDALTAPRFLFQMGEDGVLPRAFAAVLPKVRTPWVAILVHSTAAAVLGVSGQFEALAALSVLVVIIPYIIGSVAAVMLKRRGVVGEGKPLNLPFLPAIAAVAVISMAWVAARGSSLQELVETVGALAAASAIYVGSRLVRR
jgi:amino acid transporter